MPILCHHFRGWGFRFSQHPDRPHGQQNGPRTPGCLGLPCSEGLDAGSVGVLGSFVPWVCSPLSVSSLHTLFSRQGTYVLQDNSFPLLITMGSGPQYLEEAPKVLGEGWECPSVHPARPLLGLGPGLHSSHSAVCLPAPTHPSSWPSPVGYCAAPSIRWASRAWSPRPWLPCPPVSPWGRVLCIPHT